ncbi:hypothetical protein [Croceicoccus marinus]|jgi:hypothetical protein|uniref:Uncharacterized protein n=1 Tax=Croceicoccus marinus TaxID=450378 RepID=A0A7G6VSH0_9SPHN|nr:hypothetical protein [Croceicoccus marinus]QNE04685.1 hypothetical protein H4O24_12070 [Croceicoccus marinus]
MTHWSEYMGPTPEERAKAEKVQRAIWAELNLMASEGIGPQEMLSGAAAALADLVKATLGEGAIAPWFAKQAEVISDIQRGHH